MLNHSRNYNSGLQARAGIIEEDRLLAARSVCPQALDIQIFQHGALHFDGASQPLWYFDLIIRPGTLPSFTR
jgi:hypothetical protein